MDIAPGVLSDAFTDGRYAERSGGSDGPPPGDLTQTGETSGDVIPDLADTFTNDSLLHDGSIPDTTYDTEVSASEVCSDCDASPCDFGECDACCPSVSALDGGLHHTCALLQPGAVRCWGLNTHGQLGYPGISSVGDSKFLLPADVGDVDVGGLVSSISLGSSHTCAIMKNGDLRCWGDGSSGQLGYGQGIATVGSDKPPGGMPPIMLGGKAKAVATGFTHTCAIRDDDAVLCWGNGGNSQLGYLEAVVAVGPVYEPMPDLPVDVGAPSSAIAAGYAHTCHYGGE